MEKISCVTSKGGTGKTTATFELAYGLQKAGYKVLCIDMDSQANLSTLAEVSDKSRGIYDVLSGEKGMDDVIIPFRYGWIVPGSDEMSLFDYNLNHGEDDLFSLYDAMEASERIGNEEFDFILIDCPPNLGVSTMSAMVASDLLIVPTLAEEMSLQGIGILVRTMKLLEQQNPDLKIDGILINRWSGRSNMNKDMKAELDAMAEQLGTIVYKTPVRENVKLRESHYDRMAVQEGDPRSNAARDLKHFVEEFIERAKKREEENRRVYG